MKDDGASVYRGSLKGSGGALKIKRRRFGRAPLKRGDDVLKKMWGGMTSHKYVCIVPYPTSIYLES
jgi:hypothetical protein